MNAYYSSRQRGVALLTALLTTALAFILIASLLDRGELSLARTRNLLRSEQAQAYSAGLESYAAEVLLKSRSDGAGNDTNNSIWALPLPPQTVPGGTLTAQMRDLNGCFNLNNLQPGAPQQSMWYGMFQRLLGVREIDPALADAVVSWLTIGGSNSGDNYYLAQPIAYRAANRAFAHVSELRLVRGVDADIYGRLAPYVCALPPGTRLNINTASVPVLMSLSSSMTQSLAERIWQNGRANVTDLNQIAQMLLPLGQSIQPVLALLDIRSGYFLARGEIVLDDVPFTFYSLIERNAGAGVRVLARSRGSDDALIAAALPSGVVGQP